MPNKLYTWIATRLPQNYHFKTQNWLNGVSYHLHELAMETDQTLELNSVRYNLKSHHVSTTTRRI